MTTFEFPSRDAAPIIETDLMHDVADRTTSIHNRSPIVLWTGMSRLGKTTTAAWLTDRINGKFSAKDPNAFRAKHYQATELAGWHAGGKTAMGAFHSGVIGTLDSGLYKRLRAHELADLVVTGLVRERIEMVFLDEAGLYDLRALRGLVAIRDQAVKVGHRLTIVLIGMDDLPIKIGANPQIEGRVHEWCCFVPYSLDETIELVSELTDLWNGADPSDREVQRQFEFIHEITGGVAGYITVFVNKIERAAFQLDREPSVAFLKAVHLRTLKERERAERAARKGFRGPDEDDDGAPSGRRSA